MINLRVVIVDDDPIFRFIFSKMIKAFAAARIEVLGFENGIQAVDYFREHRNNKLLLPDMLFVDINMPLMTGWELMTELRDEGMDFLAQIPVFILSSSTSASDREKIKEYPFIDDYLVKPIKKPEFLKLIADYYIRYYDRWSTPD